eukprot:1491570-Amphidinium_carterae.1
MANFRTYCTTHDGNYKRIEAGTAMERSKSKSKGAASCYRYLANEMTHQQCARKNPRADRRPPVENLLQPIQAIVQESTMCHLLSSTLQHHRRLAFPPTTLKL